jgi:hypothetical protein
MPIGCLMGQVGRLRGQWVGGGVVIAAMLTFGLTARPALAGRLVFNQTPASIDRAFGRYWTKRTVGQQATYTYNPARLRRIWSDRPFITLSMNYDNDRVVSVTVEAYRTAKERSERSTAGDVINPRIAAQLFEAIFGYNPPIYKPLHLTSGSYYEYENCLGNGVLLNYSTHNSWSGGVENGMTLWYTTKCEPPYDRIQFTEDRGPSGG